ncbi:unnamed protein product, partial [Chrysoparadoxa australica]
SAPGKRDSTLASIQKLEKKREERRKNIERDRQLRAQEEKRNIAAGNPGDIDFQRLIKNFRGQRAAQGAAQPHTRADAKICIAVRKRPVSEKEVKRKDHDSVTIFNPVVTIHNCKTKVDGITKFLDNTDFQFDHTFSEEETTADVYECTTEPLVPFVLDRGRATVFAYGQTGSGKTYTMVGLQKRCGEDLFRLIAEDAHLEQSLSVYVSFFEIYGGRCQDLLNKRHRLAVREDGKGDVHIAGLEELVADSVGTLEALIEKGNRNRTTHATESNDTSSRSHAICQISLKDNRTGRLHGKLSLIDLAGSERGADTKSHNRQRRMEGAEINKSLLALKECIRALDGQSNHVPYRASKLTLVLKDSFTRKSARTVMIATVSPGASAADHTLNTLRYADRVKERKVEEFGNGNAISENRGHGPAASNSPPRPPKPEGAKRGRDSRSGPALGASSAAAPLPAARDSRARNRPAAGGGMLRSNSASSAPVDQDKISPLKERNRMRDVSASPENFETDGRERGDDIGFLHDSIRRYNEADSNEVVELHRTVQNLFEEEESLLNMHMNAIQENAELLTEEGRLLQQIQGDDVVDYDIDAYATRLAQILDRKIDLISTLQVELSQFRTHLENEETVSKRVANMPLY